MSFPSLTLVTLSWLSLLQCMVPTVAHPNELSCNQLSHAAANHQVIMGWAPKMVPWSSAPSGKLVRLGHDSKWINYSITLRSPYEFTMEATGGLTLTNYDHHCDTLSDGPGLCQRSDGSCPTQMYAHNGDCTGANECVFGISRQGSVNASLLVGWSNSCNSQVSYASPPLTGELGEQ